MGKEFRLRTECQSLGPGSNSLVGVPGREASSLAKQAGRTGITPPGFSAVETLKKPDNAISIRPRQARRKGSGAVPSESMTTIRLETDKNCPDCLRRPPAPQAITDTRAPVRCLSLNSRAAPRRPPLVRHRIHQDHEAQARRHSSRRHPSRICQRQPSGSQRRYPNPLPRSRLRRHHRTEHPRLPRCSRRQPRRPPAHQSQRRRARPAPATSSGPLLIPGVQNVLLQ